MSEHFVKHAFYLNYGLLLPRCLSTLGGESCALLAIAIPVQTSHIHYLQICCCCNAEVGHVQVEEDDYFL